MSIGQYRVRESPGWLRTNLFTKTEGEDLGPPLAVRLEPVESQSTAYLDIFVDRLPRGAWPAYVLPNEDQIYESFARFSVDSDKRFKVSFTFTAGTSGKVPVAVTINREEVIAAAKEQLDPDTHQTDEQ